MSLHDSPTHQQNSPTTTRSGSGTQEAKTSTPPDRRSVAASEAKTSSPSPDRAPSSSVVASNSSPRGATSRGSVIEQRQQRPEVVEDPLPFDVLFGKGRRFQDHTGNRRLRVIVDIHRQRYLDATCRDVKMQITTNVVQVIKSSGNRFLKYNNELQGWVEVDDEVARLKVSHAFRRIIRRRSSGSSHDEKQQLRRRQRQQHQQQQTQRQTPQPRPQARPKPAQEEQRQEQEQQWRQQEQLRLHQTQHHRPLAQGTHAESELLERRHSFPEHLARDVARVRHPARGAERASRTNPSMQVHQQQQQQLDQFQPLVWQDHLPEDHQLVLEQNDQLLESLLLGAEDSDSLEELFSYSPDLL